MAPNFSPEIQEILDSFAIFDDWENKYAYLIDLGRQLPPMDDVHKIPQNMVSGCTSKVWLASEGASDKYFFKADSDAHIVKGLLTILMKIYSGKTRQQIQQIDTPKFFDTLGLGKHLSPNRSNGFFAVTKAIIALAQ